VAEAVSKFAEHPIEMAIIDVNLRDGTAADVIRAGSSIPCILCTQDDQLETFDKMFGDHSITQNIVGYLTKPLHDGVIWNIRAGLRLGATWREQNRLVAEATAQVEEERRIIAQNLHDEIGAHLTQLSWVFGNLDGAIKKTVGQTPESTELLQGISEKGKHLVKSAFGEMSKIVDRLRPEAVNVAGLKVGIEYLIWEWQEAAPGVKFEIELGDDLDKVDTRRASTIYRIVQEGITNAMRHAEPTRIHVKLVCGESELEIAVQSTGSLLHERGNYRLTSLRERTSSLGGVLRFNIDPNLGKSFLRVLVPL
jgi:signal transduction histidine kinase